jgi:cytosine/adenosine deaminase-related metal-dependent hydrolase
MNNAVGYSRILDMYNKGIDVGIGTDGMSSDMINQMRSAFLIARHQYNDPTVGFMEIPQMLIYKNPAILNKVIGWNVGELSVGNSADIVTIDYVPPTPINESNFIGHLLFGIASANVDTTICNGRIIMRHKQIVGLNEAEIHLRSREAAVKVWEKINP